jgi:hypothetical protein
MLKSNQVSDVSQIVLVAEVVRLELDVSHSNSYHLEDGTGRLVCKHWHKDIPGLHQGFYNMDISLVNQTPVLCCFELMNDTVNAHMYGFLERLVASQIEIP